jgi:hypothetical protein
MAHWSSTDFNHYAAEDDLRNAKPRWQEIAEVYSSTSSPFSTATAPPRPSRNLGQMDRHTTEYNNGDNKFWRKRLRSYDDNVASLGASRSRSRSRAGRSQMRMFENSTASKRFRSRSRLDHGTLSKKILLFSLLALVGLFLSWFAVSVMRSPRSIGRSVAKAVWTPQTRSLYGEVRNQACNLPLIPRVLNCTHSPDTEVSRENSIRHVIPSIVFAMSENPDTVDTLLDILEDIKTQLFAIHKMEISNKNTIPIKTAEPLRIPVHKVQLPIKPIPFDRILNHTSILKAGLTDWENDKDNLLKRMQVQINSLVPEHKDGPFHKAVIRELEKMAISLEELRELRLSPLMEMWKVLLGDIPVPQDTDAETQEDTSTHPKLSILRRLILWSLPFTSPLSSKHHLTIAQRTQILHDNVLAIQPHLSAIHASNTKAQYAATTAVKLIQRNNSWVGRLGGMFWEEGKERFIGDMGGGLMEMRGLVPMLMEQRRGTRGDRRV